MKYSHILSLSLLNIVLLGAGCIQPPTASNTSDDTNTNVQVNENVDTTLTNTNSIEPDIDTSNWLTYTNEEYGFSVKYPTDWIYFNEIKEDTLVFNSEADPSLIRFTSNKNRHSASSFKDIFIQVKFVNQTNRPPVSKYIEHGEEYYIFSASWPTENEEEILNAMMESLEFDS